MKPFLFALAIVAAGCASGRTPDGTSDADAEIDRAVEELDETCPRRGTVTVHVKNRSSFDIWIAFGPYRPARAAIGFARTTYTVPRSYLENSDIVVGIERGGLAVRPPTVVPTEWVICNDATLIIDSRPEYAYFYGDLLREPQRGTEEEPDPADEATDDDAATGDRPEAPAGDDPEAGSVPEPPQGE